jgi:PAS domain S-box-containing protein
LAGIDRSPRRSELVRREPAGTGRDPQPETGARLARTYTLAVSAGVIPLIVIVVLLAGLQFGAQKAALIERLEDDASAHNLLLSGVIKNVHDYVQALATWAEIELARPHGSDDAAWPGMDRLGVLTEGDGSAGSAGGIDPVVARRLAPHMQLAHRAMPYLRWTYTFGPDWRPVSKFPVFPAHPTVAGTGSPRPGEVFPVEIAGDQRADPRLDPSTGWSPPFDDPAGAGWLVVLAQPVEAGDGFAGAVGGAVLLDFLTGFLRAFDEPAGRAWLVDPAGRVLAGSHEPGVVGLGLRQLAEVLPPDLAALPAADLLTPTPGLEPRGDAQVFTQRVSSTPWRLVYIVQASELDALILPRFAPYAVILAGLVLFSIVAHLLRQRLIVRPALAMVDFIRAESFDHAPAKPKLPAVWRPWLDAVADAFAAKRASVERMRTEAERFRQLTEANPLPVAVVEAEHGRLIYGNRVFETLFGLADGQAAGFDWARLVADPVEHARLLETLDQAATVDRLEVTAVRLDGTRFPATLTARRAVFAGTPVIVAGFLDLTDQKRAEAEIARQREALHQNEKLSALGSMLASVAHELNNPLSVVVGYSAMLRDLAGDEITKGRATRIHAAAERCAQVVRTFLAMARQRPRARRPTALEPLIETALEFTSYGLHTADVTVRRELAPGLPPVEVDFDQLTLVLMNLIVNAQHALQAVDPPRRLTIATAREADRVRIDIADNGPGIPDEIRGRVFEPFFTTKPQGIGTGIGLSVCRNLVQAHGGTIDVAPGDERGTVFSIRLPVAGVRDHPEPAEPHDPVRLPRGRILIVEDEPEVADLMREILAGDGYTIEVVASGRAALEQLRAATFDLLVSDLHMPDLDGPTLHRALLADHPELASRMLFVTGDVLAADVTGFISEAGLPVLDKPIDPPELRIQVRNALRGPPARRSG